MVSPPQPWALADRGAETGDEAAVPQVREVRGQVHDHGEHRACAGGDSGVTLSRGTGATPNPGTWVAPGLGAQVTWGWNPGMAPDRTHGWHWTGVLGQYQTGTSGWHWTGSVGWHRLLGVGRAQGPQWHLLAILKVPAVLGQHVGPCPLPEHRREVVGRGAKPCQALSAPWPLSSQIISEEISGNNGYVELAFRAKKLDDKVSRVPGGKRGRAGRGGQCSLPSSSPRTSSASQIPSWRSTASTTTAASSWCTAPR